MHVKYLVSKNLLFCSCVFETEDDKGNRGVRLSKDIVKVAGNRLSILLSLVLYFSELFQLSF